MATKNTKNNLLAEIFYIFDCHYPKTHPIKPLSSLDSSRTYGRPLENQKAGGSRELFMPENNFLTSSTKNIPKNIQI